MRLRDFGLRNGINEVIVITKSEKLNTAPIGIIVENESSVFAKAKLFPSHTRSNLERGSFFVVNVVNDATLFALATFEDLGGDYFESLDPPILKGALAFCEFEPKLEGSIVHLRLLRGKVLRNEVRAVNRGFNAVIEALIFATRLKLNPNFAEKMRECYNVIERCGGEKERVAMEIIKEKTGIR
ncbi:MAG: DUF447 domain-containing protein [Archaeoglobaceae archaeon]